MKLAACQAPLLPAGEIDLAVALIRDRVVWCESRGIAMLCCPEGFLGGLADDAADPTTIALGRGGRLDAALAPLASDRVTTIVGFTEVDEHGRLFNAGAVFHRGRVLGVYRKHHPAIRRSVYGAGTDAPVFDVDGLRVGILLCRDSTFEEPARRLVAQGATVLCVPTNNGLPDPRVWPALHGETRAADVHLATTHGVTVVRADVAGWTDGRSCAGTSAVTDRRGARIVEARPYDIGVVVAELAVTDWPR